MLHGLPSTQTWPYCFLSREPCIDLLLRFVSCFYVSRSLHLYFLAQQIAPHQGRKHVSPAHHSGILVLKLIQIGDLQRPGLGRRWTLPGSRGPPGQGCQDGMGGRRIDAQHEGLGIHPWGADEALQSSLTFSLWLSGVKVSEEDYVATY